MLLNNLVQSYWTNVQCNSVTGRLMWDYPFNNFFFIKVALCAKNLYISFKCIGILPRLFQAKLSCFLPFMLSCNINVSCKYIIFPNKANLKCYIFQYFYKWDCFSYIRNHHSQLNWIWGKTGIGYAHFYSTSPTYLLPFPLQSHTVSFFSVYVVQHDVPTCTIAV